MIFISVTGNPIFLNISSNQDHYMFKHKFNYQLPVLIANCALQVANVDLKLPV